MILLIELIWAYAHGILMRAKHEDVRQLEDSANILNAASIIAEVTNMDIMLVLRTMNSLGYEEIVKMAVYRLSEKQALDMDRAGELDDYVVEPDPDDIGGIS
jgi:hypothetical protein